MKPVGLILMLLSCALLIGACQRRHVSSASEKDTPQGISRFSKEESRGIEGFEVIDPAVDSTKPVPGAYIIGEPVSLSEWPEHVDEVCALLETRNIACDGSALSVFCLLNPNIPLSNTRSGKGVIVPRVISTSGKDGAGHRFLLKPDYSSQLALQVGRLKISVQELSSRHICSDCIAPLEGAIKSLDLANNVVRENTRPVSIELVAQLVAATDVLASLCEQTSTDGHRLSLSDIELIIRDIDVKALIFDATRDPGVVMKPWKDVNIAVHTLGSRDNSPVPNLRVYYVPEALVRHPAYARPFSTLSSPAKYVLPEADYCFWAVNPADHAQVSDILPVQVRWRGAEPEQIIDLWITRGLQRK